MKQLGLRERTKIEYFNGGHAINGEGAFRFLHEHLKWPSPGEAVVFGEGQLTI